MKERFESKFIKTENCWIWTAAKNENGYGRFRVGKKMRPAHAVSYELYIGNYDLNLDIDHLCRNASCVNPAHLQPVTHKENIYRGTSPIRLNEFKTHCPKKHEYNEENTHVRKSGARSCRVCDRENKRRRQNN